MFSLLNLPLEVFQLIIGSISSLPDIIALSSTNKLLHVLCEPHIHRTAGDHQPFPGYQRTYFHRHIVEKDLDPTYSLITSGADVNTTDTLGLSPLLTAIAHGGRAGELDTYLLLQMPQLNINQPIMHWKPSRISLTPP